MPRDGSITPRDLIGIIDVLRVECVKCDPAGRLTVEVIGTQSSWKMSAAHGKSPTW
jgi:hypothetical protein